MDDAFSGLRLSEATAPASPASLDQRLFLPSPSEATAKPSQASPTREARKERPAPEPVVRVHGRTIAPKPPLSIVEARTEQPLSAPEARERAPFDLNARPYRKDSFLFTDDEFNRLEDLKLELRRRHDLPATKNDIARIAFHLLCDDYGRDPAKSRVVALLRKKTR